MPKGVSSTYTSQRRSSAMKKVWKRKLHRRKVLKGQQKTFKTKEYKEKQSAAMVERWATKGSRQKQSQALQDAWQEEGVRERWSKAIEDSNDETLRHKKSRTRKANMRRDPEYAQKQLAKTLSNKTMTFPEEQVKDILSLLELPYEFVGNGKFMIGRYCPDFVRVDAKAIIEVYGGHWHDRPSNIRHDKKRNKFIRQQGYQMLIVKQIELRSIIGVANKIRRFDEKVMSKLFASKTQAPSRKRVKV